MVTGNELNQAGQGKSAGADRERRKILRVQNVGEKYRCNICGNEVAVTKAGGGELICCGTPMEIILGKVN